MNKKDIEMVQRAIQIAVLVLVAIVALVVGWVHLTEYLGMPREWQPCSLILLAIGAAYAVLEIIKRRSK